MQGARCGTRSRDSRIMPGPKAGAKPLSHPGIPSYGCLKDEPLIIAKYLKQSLVHTKYHANRNVNSTSPLPPCTFPRPDGKEAGRTAQHLRSLGTPSVLPAGARTTLPTMPPRGPAHAVQGLLCPQCIAWALLSRLSPTLDSQLRQWREDYISHSAPVGPPTASRARGSRGPISVVRCAAPRSAPWAASPLRPPRPGSWSPPGLPRCR